MDCWEDKYDHNIEYGGTIQFTTFRHRETAYLKKLIAEKAAEYEAPGVTRKVAFCHVPFTEIFSHPFDVASEIYKEWIALLDEIGIDLLLCGHMHTSYDWRLKMRREVPYNEHTTVVLAYERYILEYEI